MANWLSNLLVRLDPKEHSPGSTRHLGRISKRGDRYLRMLLTHGARSVLRSTVVATGAGREIEPFAEGTVRRSKKVSREAFVMPA